MGVAHCTRAPGGRFALVPRTQEWVSRCASVSKWTTCATACTPASVRPAATVSGRTSVNRSSACSRWSCTPQPEGCVCQPQKAEPSYSRPRAMRIKLGPRLRGGDQLERRDQPLRLFLLRRRAFLGDFLQDLARAVLVPDLEVGLGE